MAQPITIADTDMKLNSAARLRPWLLLGPVIVFLLLLFILPLTRVIMISFTDPTVGFDNYINFFTDPFYLRVLAVTFFTAFKVGIFCILLGFPIAYAAARYKGWLGTFILLVVGISFWTSFLVRTYAWLVVLGAEGPVLGLFRLFGWVPAPKILFTSLAVDIGIVHLMLPFMVMVLYSVMSKIDMTKIRAAESLGASPTAAFRTVYLPLTYPGMVNGFILVFVICLGFYITPELLGGPRDQMIARLIGHQIEELLEWGTASAISVILFVIALTVYAIYDRIFGLDRLYG